MCIENPAFGLGGRLLVKFQTMTFSLCVFELVPLMTCGAIESRKLIRANVDLFPVTAAIAGEAARIWQVG
jgi:hypothetical protein